MKVNKNENIEGLAGSLFLCGKIWAGVPDPVPHTDPQTEPEFMAYHGHPKPKANFPTRVPVLRSDKRL